MKPIKGYGGIYKACPTGKIWAAPSTKRPKGCYLRPWLIGHGYETVMLYKDGEGRKFLVHRLIAEAFVPNPQKKREVNHKDANRRNNVPENLEWVSSQENKSHAIKLGLYKNICSLNERDVREIRRLYSTGRFLQKDLAKTFRTSQFNISYIILGKSWKHIL